jgi:UDP-glucose 6-dehydrogenase
MLLNLLVFASPGSKVIVISILQNLISVQWSTPIFEEGVQKFMEDKESYGYELMTKVNPSIKFQKSPFLTFIYNYLISIRTKIWAKSAMES